MGAAVGRGIVSLRWWFNTQNVIRVREGPCKLPKILVLDGPFGSLIGQVSPERWKIYCWGLGPAQRSLPGAQGPFVHWVVTGEGATRAARSTAGRMMRGRIIPRLAVLLPL